MDLPRWLRHYDIDRLDQRDPQWIDWIYRKLHRAIEAYFRAEVRGLEQVPPGPALFAGNHSALMMVPDAVLLCLALYRERGLADVPFGLGHEVLINLPILNQLTVPAGAVRADHGHARELLARGHKVLVYPGSDYDAARSWRDRDRLCFGGRTGYVRLALQAGVPLVPVVTAGAQETLVILTDGQRIARAIRADRWMRIKVWPISLALPWGFMPVPLPFWPWPARILVEVLPPVRFERSGPEAAADEDYVRECAAHVEGAMQATLTRLAAERRTKA
jgi:1-acyl-sn-glycerol-3-phosphate acyltransferase